MVEMTSLPPWTSLNFPLWATAYNSVKNRTSKSLCYCICLLPNIQQNKAMTEFGKRRGRKRKARQNRAGMG